MHNISRYGLTFDYLSRSFFPHLTQYTECALPPLFFWDSDLIGCSTSGRSPRTGVGFPATTTSYQTATTFAMVCFSMYPYTVYYISTSYSWWYVCSIRYRTRPMSTRPQTEWKKDSQPTSLTLPGQRPCRRYALARQSVSLSTSSEHQNDGSLH